MIDCFRSVTVWANVIVRRATHHQTVVIAAAAAVTMVALQPQAAPIP